MSQYLNACNAWEMKPCAARVNPRNTNRLHKSSGELTLKKDKQRQMSKNKRQVFSVLLKASYYYRRLYSSNNLTAIWPRRSGNKPSKEHSRSTPWVLASMSEPNYILGIALIAIFITSITLAIIGYETRQINDILTAYLSLTWLIELLTMNVLLLSPLKTSNTFNNWTSPLHTNCCNSIFMVVLAN